MATKLKNLRIKKVDFVDEGANPDAHIRMLKRKGEGVQQGDGEPAGSAGKMLGKLLSFIGKAAGMGQEEIDTAVEQIEKDSAASFREKLNEARMRKIADEIWDTCFALQASLCSVLTDEALDSAGATEAMQASLEEFDAAVRGFIAQWSGGIAAGIVKRKEEVSRKDVEIMKSAVERLNASIQKFNGETLEDEDSGEGKTSKKEEDSENGQKPEQEPVNEESQKGEGKEMKIDKSKLTDAERAFLESIEKRYGAEGGTESGSMEGSMGQQPAREGADMVKSAAVPIATPSMGTPMQQEEEADGIYKGLHPAVRAELEGLKKFREAAEERELAQVVKKYAVIGKKEEELVPMLKGLKAAGGSAYQDMISVLDHAVDAVEKSGVFSEIGKSGHGAQGGSQAEARIDGIAKGYMEKDPGLSHLEAVAKAWENNPEIMDEYEEEAGF